MTRKSGWCLQQGRGGHDGCRVPLECPCACHEDAAKVALLTGIRASKEASNTVESGAESGPESALTDRGLATVSTRPKGA